LKVDILKAACLTTCYNYMDTNFIVPNRYKFFRCVEVSSWVQIKLKYKIFSFRFGMDTDLFKFTQNPT
jgi:hypothetical protein